MFRLPFLFREFAVIFFVYLFCSQTIEILEIKRKEFLYFFKQKKNFPNKTTEGHLWFYVVDRYFIIKNILKQKRNFWWCGNVFLSLWKESNNKATNKKTKSFRFFFLFILFFTLFRIVLNREWFCEQKKGWWGNAKSLQSNPCTLLFCCCCFVSSFNRKENHLKFQR